MVEIIADPAVFRNQNLQKTLKYISEAVQKGIITKSDEDLITKYVKSRAAKTTAHTTHQTAATLTRMREYIPVEYKKLNIETLEESITAFNTGKISKTAKVHPGRSYKDNTRIAYINELKGFFKWAMGKGYSKLSLSDIKSIKAPSPDKQTFTPADILRKEEIEAVIKACDNVRDRAFISALFDGGFRAIELCTMAWDDLHWSESEEHEGRFIVAAFTSKKTGTPRRVLLTRSGAFLNEWRNMYSTYTGGAKPEGENAIFVNRDGKTFNYNTAEKIIEKLRRKVKSQGFDLGKKLKLHQFRRAAITHEADDGRPISHICMEKWGRSYSPMIERYNRPGEQAIDSSKCEITGVPSKRKYNKREKVLEPVECPNCGFICKPLSVFCARCGRTLTEEAAKTQDDLIALLSQKAREDPQGLIEALKRIPLQNKK